MQRVKVISADKALIRMPANKAFTPKVDGWFCPDATMKEVLEALQMKFEDLTPQ